MTSESTVSRPLDPVSIESSMRTWGQLGAYLLDVKARQTWANAAPSFTEWVKQCAKRLSRTEASLWRCISSGRFYRSRAAVFEKKGVVLADLPQLPGQVSSESLELLAKILRVAPLELIENIELKALRGEVSRGALRSIWETYRPVLKGRTARGRNAETPSFDERDPVQRDGRAEADSIMALRKAGASWTGDPDATYYGVFPTDHPSMPAHLKDVGLDAVMVVKSKNRDVVELHGVAHRQPSQMPQTFHAHFLQSIDRAWVIILGEKNPDLTSVPQGFGVLSTESGEVVICREPEPYESKPSLAREYLMRALLLRSLAT